MALNADKIVEEILDEGKNLQKEIIDRLSKVLLEMPGMVDASGKPAGKTKPFEPTIQGQMMEFDKSNKTNEKYTGVEAIVEIMVEQIIRVSVPEIIKHIENNLEVSVPIQTVITKVSGGTINATPIACDVK